MCRLFGMHAGREVLPATFWLVDATDSMQVQSHRNLDGAGIGAFDAHGRPVVDKQPLAAWHDPAFAAAAHGLRGTTFVAHVRHASTGRLSQENTHPFVQDGRLFAHNGVVGGLAELDERLVELGADRLVHGQTDSERIFGLVCAETANRSGDLGEGLVAGVGWVLEHLPVYALNLVLATATDLWALRYPATHELHWLSRPAGGTGTSRDLDARGSHLRAHCGPLVRRPAVVVASERLDDDPGWREVLPGQLLHVDADLTVAVSTPFPATPRHALTLDDLDERAAASQHCGRPTRGQQAGPGAKKLSP